MKLCAIIVTYYPNVNELLDNVKILLADVGHLIIWENTPLEDASKHSLRSVFEGVSNVSFLTTGRNEGIAYALNRGIDWAKDHGFTHLMTMDQDSTWQNLSMYIDTIQKYRNKYDIFAPNINLQHSGQKLVEVDFSITSGTVYAISLFDRFGNFEEKLFIDTIDTEFGLRLKKYGGIRTCLVPYCHLVHHLGNPIRGKHGISSGYSAMRRFYIVRNHIWLFRRYYSVMKQD